MSHGLEETDSMFTYRDDPWHGLVEAKKRRPKSIEEAVEWAGLGWEVIQREVQVRVPVAGEKSKTQLKKLEGYWVNLRADTMDPLGVVTDRYVPVQNEEAFEFLASVFGSELHFETAGSLMGGRRVWVMMKLPENIEVGGDLVVPYSFISNSHDGKSSVMVALTPIKIVCKNTLTAAIGRAKGQDAQRTYMIRHLGDMDQKLAEARQTLDVTIRYYEQFKQVGDGMARKKCSDKKAVSVIEQLLPVEKTMGERAVLNREESRQVVMSIYKGEGADGDTTGNAPGTFWCLYNAATEWADWYRPERKTGGRFQRALDDPDAFKATAFRTILDESGLAKV